jgi:hypothetical protein
VDGTVAQAEKLSFGRRFQRKANSRILKKLLKFFILNLSQYQTYAVFSIEVESVARFTSAVEAAWRVDAFLLAPSVVN